MTLLQDAAEAAVNGRVHGARSLGLRALHDALVNRDHLQELAARLQLTELMLSLGVGGEAAMHARKAVESLVPDTPPLLRVKSLVNWSYAASFVGDGSNALRASIEARACADAAGLPDLQAIASNYFGLANMWDGRWETAKEAFSHSQACEPNNARPLFNSAINEVLRTTVDVTLEGARSTGHTAEWTISEALSRPLPPMLGVVMVSSGAVAAFLRSIVASWRGDEVGAMDSLREARDHLVRGGDTCRWLKPYFPWAECELAFARKNYADAAAAATKVMFEADEQGSEQAHWIGRILRVRCLHVMGDHDRASHDWRYLWVRSMRRQSSAGAPPVVQATLADGDAALPGWSSSFNLTVAETSVVKFLLQGHRPADIAAFRSTSVGTVRSQLASVFSKTGFKSQAQLVTGVLSREKKR